MDLSNLQDIILKGINIFTPSMHTLDNIDLTKCSTKMASKHQTADCHSVVLTQNSILKDGGYELKCSCFQLLHDLHNEHILYLKLIRNIYGVLIQETATQTSNKGTNKCVDGSTHNGIKVATIDAHTHTHMHKLVCNSLGLRYFCLSSQSHHHNSLFFLLCSFTSHYSLKD